MSLGGVGGIILGGGEVKGLAGLRESRGLGVVGAWAERGQWRVQAGGRHDVSGRKRGVRRGSEDDIDTRGAGERLAHSAGDSSRDLDDSVQAFAHKNTKFK